MEKVYIKSYKNLIEVIKPGHEADNIGTTRYLVLDSLDRLVAPEAKTITPVFGLYYGYMFYNSNAWPVA